MIRMQAWTERLILGIMVLNGVWILAIPSFPTLDGWTHLHTARMMAAGRYGQLYCENPGMVPNQMGHWVLMTLLRIFSPMHAERVLLALIVTTMGLGSYVLARAFARPNPLVLLVLPFTYGFLLVMGFHNFLLGVGLALLFAGWWVRAQRVGIPHYAALLAATILLHQTHSMALVFFLLLCGTHELAIATGYHSRTEGWAKGRIFPMVAFAVAILPAIVLFLRFNLAQDNEWVAGNTDHLRELIDLRYLVLYARENEEKFTYAMKLILFGSVALALVHRFVPTVVSRWKLEHTDLLLLLSGLFLLLYFTVPDSSGYAGYISLRLQLFALLCLILWTAMQTIPLATTIAPTLMVIMVHQARLNHIKEFMAPLAGTRDLVLDAASHLPEGAVVLPIHTVSDWALDHIPSLLAVERNVELMYNYEAGTGYFPLNWCSDLPGHVLRHLGGQDRCLAWLGTHIAEGAKPKIDHIVLIGKVYDNDPCYKDALESTLREHFEPDYANGLVSIYRRKVR
jgi:hypothetical protein